MSSAQFIQADAGYVANFFDYAQLGDEVFKGSFEAAEFC
jgi:hypothetical protein